MNPSPSPSALVGFRGIRLFQATRLESAAASAGRLAPVQTRHPHPPFSSGSITPLVLAAMPHLRPCDLWIQAVVIVSDALLCVRFSQP